MSAVYPRPFGKAMANIFQWLRYGPKPGQTDQEEYFKGFASRLPTPKEALEAIQEQVQKAGGFTDKDPGWPDLELLPGLDRHEVLAALRKRKGETAEVPAASDKKAKFPDVIDQHDRVSDFFVFVVVFLLKIGDRNEAEVQVLVQRSCRVRQMTM